MRRSGWSAWDGRFAAPVVCSLVALGMAGPGAAVAAKWQAVPVPMPGVATSVSLNAVACVHAHSCWTVGSTGTRHDTDRALAERWNGRRWTVVPVPSPGDYGATELTGLACSGGSACIAVGQRGAGQGGTLVERWNGRRWSVQDAPNPAGSSLSGVSCSHASDCLAVGNSGSFDSTDIFNYSLNLHWNGTKWTAEPYKVTGTLNAVSCTSAAFCAAVGYLADSAGYQSAAEQWNGTSVSDVPSGDNNASEPESLSCVSSKFCMAVGTAQGDVVGRWNGRRWRFAGSPGGLDTVWCLTSHLCVAAGARQPNEQRSFARVERWNGARWSVEPVPAVAGTVIYGVTCTGPSACIAVGSSGSGPLALRYR
jgi:hypothetical protein